MREMLPPIAERRALLEQRVAQYKMSGYSDTLEALALEAQLPAKGTEPQHEAEIAMYRERGRNMYAAAVALQSELDALPDEADEPPF